MKKLTITEAHRATGKARTTIERAIANGTLSAEKTDAGTTLIDVSELQRVYGEVNPAAIEKPQRKDAALQVDALKDDTELQLLQLRLESTERERDEAKQREREERDRHQETKELRDWFKDQLEQANKVIAALPAATVTHIDAPLSDQQPKRGFWKRLIGR